MKLSLSLRCAVWMLLPTLTLLLVLAVIAALRRSGTLPVVPPSHFMSDYLTALVPDFDREINAVPGDLLGLESFWGNCLKLDASCFFDPQGRAVLGSEVYDQSGWLVATLGDRQLSMKGKDTYVYINRALGRLFCHQGADITVYDTKAYSTVDTIHLPEGRTVVSGQVYCTSDVHRIVFASDDIVILAAGYGPLVLWRYLLKEKALDPVFVGQEFAFVEVLNAPLSSEPLVCIGTKKRSPESDGWDPDWNARVVKVSLLDLRVSPPICMEFDGTGLCLDESGRHFAISTVREAEGTCPESTVRIGSLSAPGETIWEQTFSDLVVPVHLDAEGVVLWRRVGDKQSCVERCSFGTRKVVFSVPAGRAALSYDAFGHTMLLAGLDYWDYLDVKTGHRVFGEPLGSMDSGWAAVRDNRFVVFDKGGSLRVWDATKNDVVATAQLAEGERMEDCLITKKGYVAEVVNAKGEFGGVLLSQNQGAVSLIRDPGFATCPDFHHETDLFHESVSKDYYDDIEKILGKWPDFKLNSLDRDFIVIRRALDYVVCTHSGEELFHFTIPYETIRLYDITKDGIAVCRNPEETLYTLFDAKSGRTHRIEGYAYTSGEYFCWFLPDGRVTVISKPDGMFRQTTIPADRTCLVEGVLLGGDRIVLSERRFNRVFTATCKVISPSPEEVEVREFVCRKQFPVR